MYQKRADQSERSENSKKKDKDLSRLKKVFEASVVNLIRRGGISKPDSKVMHSSFKPPRRKKR